MVEHSENCSFSKNSQSKNFLIILWFPRATLVNSVTFSHVFQPHQLLMTLNVLRFEGEWNVKLKLRECRSSSCDILSTIYSTLRWTVWTRRKQLIMRSERPGVNNLKRTAVVDCDWRFGNLSGSWFLLWWLPLRLSNRQSPRRQRSFSGQLGARTIRPQINYIFKIPNSYSSTNLDSSITANLRKQDAD